MDAAALLEYGLDSEKGISRFLGDESMFRFILKLFLDDDTIVRGRAAYESRDYERLFHCMHELKGVSGNASLPDLYKAVNALVEYLREGKSGKEDVDGMFATVEAEYVRAKEGVTLALSEA